MVYNPKEIEKKWQKIWSGESAESSAVLSADSAKSGESGNLDSSFEPKNDFSLPKKYILSMLPYPSGNLHMGHVRNYSIGDAIARYYRKNGFNVLHPIGWDSFGMPAENAAIKHNLHPKTWTYENIANMQKSLKSLGFSFSKNREFATSDPIYTKWEQEFFNQMWENDLVYRKKAYLNWCPNDKTVLANEQVVDGKCWRCDAEVVQKEMHQYYLRITKYADELLSCLEDLEGNWSKQVITMQKNWIGKSLGLEFSFKLERPIGEINEISVFTTRADTIYGVTYCAIAPEHELVKHLLKENLLSKDKADLVTSMQNMIFKDRVSKEKIGVSTGIYALHPLTKKRLEIFVANFVLMDYGSGAVMCVPAHDERDFEFAKKYNLEIKQVVCKKGDFKGVDSADSALDSPDLANLDSAVDSAKNATDSTNLKNADSAKNSALDSAKTAIDSTDSTNLDLLDSAFIDDGILIASGEFSGFSSEEGRSAIIKYFEKNKIGKSVINFKLRDWGISRQRYWGTPIPLIHCEKCGIVKETNLPVLLPDDISLDGEGSPLEKHPTWKFTKCPKCGGEALRECDTMDTFVESSWYFLRYTTPRELWEKSAFDTKSLEYWLNVDEYIGGIEHAVLHLLYARFFTKVLRDLGHINIDEPFARLLTQGMVLKDGFKMSKSKGNVVSPSDIIEAYGADSARLFILFAAPPKKELEWNDDALEGAYRFINRIFLNADKAKIENLSFENLAFENLNKDEKYARKKVYEALSKYEATFSNRDYPLNTLIASCMEAFNALNAQENAQVWFEGYYILLNILEPIIPHTSYELSQKLFNLENLRKIEIDNEALKSESINIAITINGKKRGEIEVAVNTPNDELLALAKSEVSKWLEEKTIIKEIIVPNKLVNLVVK
ncbi:leucine--tRNA ligase [Helicobacter sp. 16-1353]|nr:class I tRNA ligase family protein [Helicobacter sp. 16-1353]RAX54270.1 leucine--tRNA ligase [Helicobacter sp. 16-1353]